MILFGISGDEGGFDPLILLLFGLFLEAIFGQFLGFTRWACSPVTLIGNLVSWCDQKLNREGRSSGDRAVRGAIVALLVICLAASAGWFLAWLTQNVAATWIIETITIVFLLDQRGTQTILERCRKALQEKKLSRAREHLSLVCCQPLGSMDFHNLARTCLEVSACALARGTAGPVFWYVLFGLPGMMIFRAVDIMSDIVGHPTERHRAFGFTAARLNDILIYLPARLAGIYIVFGSVLVPTSKPVLSTKIMLRDSDKYHSPGLGWPVAAMAGALNLALAGPRKLDGAMMREAWIGDGTAKATTRDIGRAFYLALVANLINSVWVAALSVIRLI